MNNNHHWVSELQAAVTVCDKNGVILYMNNKSEATFNNKTTEVKPGYNLIECHPEPARTKLLELLQSEKSNTYTIMKNGVKKLIHQLPWFENNQYMGFVELSFEIPVEMPHFVRN